MKRLLPLILIGLAGMAACERPPEYDNVPRLTFEDVYFIDNPVNGEVDTLVIEVYFEDGNGDIGLTQEDVHWPYHEFEYITDESGDKIKYGSREGMPPYNPRDYYIETVAIGEQDTFLVSYNDNHYNFFIDMFIKKGGEYEKVDPFESFASPINARIPYLKDSDDDKTRALEGSIKYKWESRGWLYRFGLDTLKLNVRIQDRSLQSSNTVESPDFTLVGVTR